MLTWEDVMEQEDFMITYMLYLEGKTIQMISKIRGLSPEIIKDQLIKGKMKMKKAGKAPYPPGFVKLLAYTKEERITYLETCPPEERERLILYLMGNLGEIDQAEDKMIAIWIAGQLQDTRLLRVIQQEINHPHGGVRRMVCSALGKIPHESNLEVLYRGLQDGKPQVRQYAARALGKIGDERCLPRIRGVMQRPGELDYVKRAYQQTIEIIEEKRRKA